jgi:hypothetical protein
MDRQGEREKLVHLTRAMQAVQTCKAERYDADEALTKAHESVAQAEARKARAIEAERAAIQAYQEARLAYDLDIGLGDTSALKGVS